MQTGILKSEYNDKDKLYYTTLIHTHPLPLICKTLTIESVDAILHHIKEVTLHSSDITQKQQVDSLIQQQKNLLATKFKQIESDYEDQIKKLYKDIEKLKQQAENANRSAEFLQHQLTSSQKQIIESLETKYKEEKKEITARQKEYEARVEEKHREEKREIIERQKEYEKRMIDTLEKDLIHERQSNLDTKKKVLDLEEQIANRKLMLANSSTRGKTGEQDFQTLLKDTKNWDLVDQSKEKDSMDFLLLHKGINIRFDVKNHESSLIPELDVVKVRKDLRIHPETDCGVLVAMHQDVYYNKQRIDEIVIEWTNTQQLIIIIPRFLSLDLKITLNWLETIFSCIKPYRKILAQNELNFEVALNKEREKNLSVASILEIAMTEITQDIKNLNRDKRTALAHINIMGSTAEKAFSSSITRMQNMLSILKDEDVPAAEETVEVTQKKTRSRAKKNSIDFTTVNPQP